MNNYRIAAIAFAAMTLAGAANAAAATATNHLEPGRQSVRDWCDQAGGLLTEDDMSSTCLVPASGATITCHTDGECIRIAPGVTGRGSEPVKAIPSIGLGTGAPPNVGTMPSGGDLLPSGGGDGVLIIGGGTHAQADYSGGPSYQQN